MSASKSFTTFEVETRQYLEMWHALHIFREIGIKIFKNAERWAIELHLNVFKIWKKSLQKSWI